MGAPLIAKPVPRLARCDRGIGNNIEGWLIIECRKAVNRSRFNWIDTKDTIP